jgi:secreted PhoX family phosphatase
MTYKNSSTKGGLFDGTPDQLQRIVHSGNEDEDNQQHSDVSVLYFSEEAGKDSGVHGRTPEGDYFTILESPVYSEEITGIAFSPDGLRLYLAYQTEGKDIRKVVLVDTLYALLSHCLTCNQVFYSRLQERTARRSTPKH